MVVGETHHFRKPPHQLSPHPFGPTPPFLLPPVVMTEATSGPSVTPMLKLKAMEPKILGPDLSYEKKTPTFHEILVGL